MAPDPGKWERMAFIPKSRYVSDPASVDRTPFPVYSALVAQWVQAGRTVPGMPDREWERLMATPVWPTW
ncbi:hypothetical protein [Streptomyces zaomyceticus]|uniref:hypothetical protein n=1 Tax=Streptomyces zaomyceticus TaxID=68286 RepID=UPI002E0DA1ED|nr:hypothetical protein OG237_27140 [Streptomyces zaomyceticus]